METEKGKGSLVQSWGYGDVIVKEQRHFPITCTVEPIIWMALGRWKQRLVKKPLYSPSQETMEPWTSMGAGEGLKSGWSWNIF